MKSEFIFSGIGGQGVMSIGELVCSAAVKKGYEVTFAPSYGQEKRGGRTMCQIVVSKRMGSPIISAADLLLVMDERSLGDYEGMVREGGCLILNSSLITRRPSRTDVQIVPIPMSELAKNAGNARAANMVALGAAIKYLPFVTLEEVRDELPGLFPGDKARLIPLNEQALETGYGYPAE